MSFIAEPSDQVVLNTPSFQNSFENDSRFGVTTNAPAAVYLSRLLNLNLDYLLEPNEISAQIIGFEPNFVSINSNIVTMSINPGVAIVDKTLIELTSSVNIDIDGNFLFSISDTSHNNKIVLVVEYEFKNSIIQNNFKINAYLYNDSTKQVQSPSSSWNTLTHNFVIGVLKIYRDNDVTAVANDLTKIASDQSLNNDCLALYNSNINNDLLTSLVLETGDNINFGTNPQCGPDGVDTIPFEILDIINAESIFVTQDLVNQASLDAICLAQENTNATTAQSNINNINTNVVAAYVKCSDKQIIINNMTYTIMPRTNVYNLFKGFISTF